MYKALTYLTIFVTGFFLSFFLFYENKDSSGLLSLNHIKKNSHLAPKMLSLIDGPSGPHKSKDSTGCIKCHGLGEDSQEIRTRFLMTLNKLSPLIPHVHILDTNGDGINEMNCLICHRLDI